MTGLQLAALTGLFLATGAVGIVWWALPGTAALGPALARLDGHATLTQVPLAVGGDVQDRLGAWFGRRLPESLWRTPTRELALLRRTPANFYGEKLLLAAIGLVGPPLILGGLLVMGVRLPVTVPLGLSLLAAVVLFVMPNLSIGPQAAAARLEFNHALSSYIDLVALERRAGSGARQALENAARVGRGHWVFDALADALAASGTDGRRPFEAFADLAKTLGVPQLEDLAAIMALAEQQTMPVYQTLRDHNRALRTAMLTDEQARANAANQLLAIPETLLVAVFVAILLGPQVMTLITSS